MVLKGKRKNLAWPVTVAALFALSAQAGTLTGGVASPEQAEPVGQQENVDEDSPGFIRNHTWSGSFDRAGDATRAAELELKTNNIECKEENFSTDNAAPELVQQRMADCLQVQRNAQTYAKDAEGIRKMQRTFAHVSRASDVAAVGAIGAVGYAQLIKKDESQAATMEGVAKIQETAGYVSYATGAADISMGAYALAVQKSKLEKMNKTLSGISKSGMQLSTADSALVSKLKNAAEQTKKAAISHMAYGAGKVAVGYASMYLADKNREIAASLGSIDPNMMNTGITTAPAAPYVYQGANGTAYYQNNNPNIGLPDGTSTSGTGAGTASNDSFSGAGGGASVMPSAEFRQPASVGKGSNLGGLGSGGGSAKSGGPEAALESSAEAEKAKDPTPADAGLNLSGGGGSRYGGGGTASADEAAPIGQVLEGSSSNSKATGVNPNSLYRDAMEGLDESEAQASMAGVSGSNKTLFQVVKLKYNKMMEVGRLQGPGAVEVRN